MTKTFQFALIGLIILTVGCKSTNKNDEEEKQVVTVSILPIETFVKKIAGDDFKVNVLLPPGASPADFTLIPSQLKDIANSEVWFRIGYIGFEYSWREKIEQTNRNMKVVNLSEGLDLVTDEYLPSGKKISTGGVNPHTWLSPALVKQMAERITCELSLLNPGKKDEYEETLSQFIEEIDELDKDIRTVLKPYEDRQIILFHPSLSYFARDYELIQYSLEPGGKQPTPQRMAALVDFAKQEDIGVIYIQSDLDREQARVFAEEIDGEVIEMWPLNPDWEENLLEIANVLVEHFK